MSKEIARKWLLQALHDLEIAEKTIGIEGYDVAAFLAHQAVEKLLKCLILLKGGKNPKSHHLDELAAALGASEEVLDGVEDFTADYMFARYPDASDDVPFRQYNREIALEKVSLAKHIFGLLRKQYEGMEKMP